MLKLKENLNSSNNSMKQLDPIEIYILSNWPKPRMRLPKLKEDTRLLITKLPNWKKKLTLKKMHYLGNMQNIKKRIKPFKNTLENWKERKQKPRLKKRKARIKWVRLGNCILWFKSLQIKDKSWRRNMKQ